MSDRALSPRQFPAEGQEMPIEQAKDLRDPAFRDWNKFKSQNAGYIDNLGRQIRQEGLQRPITIRRDKHPYIWDGHHRLAALEDMGAKTIPWRWSTPETEPLAHGV